MTVLCVVPARGGSKRIPKKNMALVGGESLVVRALRCAKRASETMGWLPFLSTDDKEIALLARANDVKLHWREGTAAGDVPIEQVVQNIVWTYSPDAVVIAEPTCPQRTPELLIAAQQMSANLGISVVSCHRGSKHTWVRNGGVWALRGAAMAGPFAVLETERLVDINTPKDLERARAVLGGGA